MDAYQFRDNIPAIDILEPCLPQPWIHYLSNGTMHAFVSQTGGGFAWWKDPVMCRLTRYRMFHLPMDRPGFYLYIAEEGQSVFCPTFQPVKEKAERRSCSFSPGMAEYQCSCHGLLARQQMYITPDENLLVWDVTIRNLTDRERKLNVTAYTELSQMKWQAEQNYGYYWRHMLQTRLGPRELLYYLYQFREKTDDLSLPLVLFGSSAPLRSFSTDRGAFMGAYRDESDPAAMERGYCGNETMLSGEPCFAFQTRQVLRPGEEIRVSFFLGIAENGLSDFRHASEQAGRMAALGRSMDWLDAEKHAIRAFWDAYLNHTGCRLPDAALQRMISVWGPVNCMTTARYSRAVNTEAPGVRGIGYRDSAQDMLAMSMRDPRMAKNTLRLLLEKQFPNGSAVHLIPLNRKAQPDTATRCDSHLWLPMLLYAILAETGDAAVLEESVPYLSPDDARSAYGEATVWQHMMAAVDFTRQHLGRHGLPLTLRGDWNDIIGKFSEKGCGESVFAAMQYLVSLKLLEQIAERYGLREKAYLRACIEEQKAAVERCGYNGQWWYRCFDDDGSPIGGPRSAFGKLWLNPQSWAVISGVGTTAQNRSAMEAVYRQLCTDVGLRLLYPGFQTYPNEPEPFTGYNPGNGENGAIFCHANSWAVIAEAMLGNGDRAWEYYERIAPQKALERLGLDRYRAEPYAWASNIVGPENPKFGWGNVTHVTGTAAWMDIAANAFLLGLRPTLTGVIIAPVMKREWPEMWAERVYRGTRIHMLVRNPNHVTGGLAGVTLDGVPLSDGFLPEALLRGKSEVRLEVILGPQ